MDEYKPAILYGRVSSAQQTEGDGERRQNDAVTNYAKKHGYTVVDQAFDEGVSALNAGNALSGELKRIIDDVIDKKYDYNTTFICDAWDRISRANPLMQQKIILEFLLNGVNIITVSNNQTFYHSRHELYKEHALTNSLLSSVAAATSHHESINKQSNILASWEGKREKAIKDKTPTTSIVPAWLVKEDDKIKVKDGAKELILKIYKMYTVDRLGYTAIATRLNNDGDERFFMKTAKEEHKRKPWNSSVIRQILTNKALYGVYQPRLHTVDPVTLKKVKTKLPPIKEYYPAILTEDEFLHCAAIAAAKRPSLVKGFGTSTGGRVHEYKNIFVKIGKCDFCGGNLTYKKRATEQAADIFCRTCTRTNIPYVDAVEWFVGIVSCHIDVQTVLKGVTQSRQDKIDSNNLIQHKIDKQKKKAVRVTKQLTQLDVDDEEMEEVLSESLGAIKKEIKELKDQLVVISDVVGIETDRTQADIDRDLQNGVMPIEYKSLSLEDLQSEDARKRMINQMQTIFEKVVFARHARNHYSFVATLKNGEHFFMSMWRKGRAGRFPRCITGLSHMGDIPTDLKVIEVQTRSFFESCDDALCHYHWHTKDYWEFDPKAFDVLGLNE